MSTPSSYTRDGRYSSLSYNEIPPRPVENDMENSRTLPSPSASPHISWDNYPTPGFGGVYGYGSNIGRQLPVERGVHTTALDPLQQWYTGSDGPWIPKPIADSGYGARHHSISSVFRGDIWKRDEDCQSLADNVAEYQPFQVHHEAGEQHSASDAWKAATASANSSGLVCSTCHKAVKTQSELKKHDLRHRKLFVCKLPGCPRVEGFSTNNDLDRHTRSKHPLSTPQPEQLTKKYRCQVEGCKSKGKSWPRLDNFRSHLKRVHRQQLRSDKEFEDMACRGEFWERRAENITASENSRAISSSANPEDSKMFTVLGLQDSVASKEPDLTRSRKLPEQIGNFKRKAVRILLNGKDTLARPDTGSEKDIISLSLAEEHNIDIQCSESDKGLFSLGNGKTIQSIGRAYVPCSLFGDANSKEHRWFHVLSKLAVPLVLGMSWIEKIGLYTKRRDLLVECPSWFGNMPALKWLGSPQGRVSFTADGKPLVGCADTGSDLDFMSLKCARRRGFKIDTRQQSRTCVMMADGTITTTEGKIHVSSIELGNFDSFEMEFHVLAGLPLDVVFGEEFLEQVDAFNTCSEIMDTGDPYLHGLNTLINMGPVQSFLSKMFGQKKVEAIKQEGVNSGEEELYWKNKATRSFARVTDERRNMATNNARAGPSIPDGTDEICSQCSGYKGLREDDRLSRGKKRCRCQESGMASDPHLDRRGVIPS